LYVSAPPAAPGAEAPSIFGGADERAQQAIGDIAPGYEPWFAPVFEPASGEIASLLFALQAAIGAGVIGFWLGLSVARDRASARGANVAGPAVASGAAGVASTLAAAPDTLHDARAAAGVASASVLAVAPDTLHDVGAAALPQDRRAD
jgi:cobalt/nickel transport protein